MDVGAPGALMGTLQALLARGRPLEQALAPFTANVAELLRLPGKGRLQAGADADLVVLAGDNAVQHAMARGRWHRFDARPRIQGPFEKEVS
jgi:beta-aspartyl-dipeptidase (metallo-type)